MVVQVCYQTKGFLDKNHDALHPDLREVGGVVVALLVVIYVRQVVEKSTNAFVSELFGVIVVEDVAETATKGRAKKKKTTVGAKFRVSTCVAMFWLYF